MRCLATLIGISFATTSLAAQLPSAVVFSMDADEFALDGAGGHLGLATLNPDELGMVVPDPANSYSMAAFLSAGAQHIYIGDADSDGLYVDSGFDGPGGDVDALMIKRFIGAPSGPIAPRSFFFSKEGTESFGPGFQDADVFTYLSQGVLATFVSEAQLQAGMGTTDNIDLNAICQTAAGDILFSISDFSISVISASGPITVTDGDLLLFPSGDVTYDVDGNVVSLNADSVQRIAAELDVIAVISASGVRTSVGTKPVSSIDLSALDIDPAGGSWSPPLAPGLSLPNLIFAWEGFTNDGALISTAGGGSLAVLNGVTMGSTQATSGAHLGLLPDSTGVDGVNALALIANQPAPLLVETWPTNLISSTTTRYTEQHVSGATPGGLVVFFYDLAPNAPGGSLSAVTIPAFRGAIYGDSFLLPVVDVGVADGGGRARFQSWLPPHLIGSGVSLALQVLDFAKLQFGEPVGMQFL